MIEPGSLRRAAVTRWRAVESARSWVAGFVAVLICVLGLALRLRGAAHDLDSPLIDEHEVVEQAAAFMGGDYRYHFVKYGPFTMYVVSGVYRLVAAVRGVTALEYASKVFFEGEEHYFIARAYAAFTLSALALVSFQVLRRQYGFATGLLAAALLGLPFVDILTRGVRIDTPQAAFQGMALLVLLHVVTQPRKRYWILAGALAGLAIASKPLPGLLVLPSFVVTSWLATGPTTGSGTRSWAVRLGSTVASPGAWLAALACAVFAALADPEILHIQQFVAGQREAVALHTGQMSWGRSSVFDSARELGLPFLLALGFSALGCLAARDRRALVVASFVVIYPLAFAGRDSRLYFYVAPAVAACLLVAQGLAATITYAERRWQSSEARWAWAPLASMILASVILALPSERLWARCSVPSSATLARQWVYEQVPPDTGLFFVGRRNMGPQLVAADVKVQKQWGGHFLYGRGQYPFLKQAFKVGYESYVAARRPRYDIAVHDGKPQPRGAKGMPRSITDSLLGTATKTGRRYIIVAGFSGNDVFTLRYRWFERAILEKQFGSIAIFRVPDISQSARAPE